MIGLNIKKNIYLFLGLFLSLIILFEISFLLKDDFKNIFNKNAESLLNKYAKKVINICKEERYRPACYDKEIPKLMDDISMEDAFKVTSIIQSLDSGYPYCHVLGHELSAREVVKDPSKWKDVVARVPSGVCSNGGIHGAFQERFRAEYLSPEEIEKIKPELMDVCEKREGWNPTGLEQGSCYHALGHLTMYMTSAEIKPSLKLCNEIAKKENHDFSQVCFDGAFMQIYQPLEPEDFDLIKGKEVKASNLQNFCLNFSGKERSSCWSEGWPLFRNQIMTASGLNKYCSNSLLQDKSDNDRCFLGLFYVVTAQMNFNTKDLNKLCSELPFPRNNECFSSVASRMIETDYKNITNAVKFCEESKNKGRQEACYGELVKYSTYNFHKGSKEFYDLCNSLPISWKDKCLNI